MTKAVPQAEPRFAVLVSGPTEAVVRRFLARYVKPALSMRKNQWRARYREQYALVVLSRPLRQGRSADEDAAALYGPHAGSAVLVVAARDEGAPGSGFAAARGWLKAQGFDPVAWVQVPPGGPESATIDLGTELVNFVNQRCPWRSDEIEDLDAYLAKSNKPLW